MPKLRETAFMSYREKKWGKKFELLSYCKQQITIKLEIVKWNFSRNLRKLMLYLNNPSLGDVDIESPNEDCVPTGPLVSLTVD